MRDDMLWMRVPRNRKVGRLGALCAAGRLLRLRYRPAVRVVRGGVVVVDLLLVARVTLLCARPPRTARLTAA